MNDVKYCFAFIHDPGDFHSRTRNCRPGRYQGHEESARSAVMASLITRLGGNEA